MRVVSSAQNPTPSSQHLPSFVVQVGVECAWHPGPKLVGRVGAFIWGRFGMSEAWQAVVAVLNDPVVRAASVVFSAASLVFGIWAFRRTSAAANTFIRHVGADHARYLEDRWLRAYELTMSNPVFAEGTARLFGAENADQAKREAVLLIYLNVPLTSFKLMKSGVVAEEDYKAHMTSFFASVRGDRDSLMRAIELPGYDQEFREECRRYLSLP
jgi:hypothetical protein